MFTDSVFTQGFLTEIYPQPHPLVQVIAAFQWRKKAFDKDLWDFISRQARNIKSLYKILKKQNSSDVTTIFYNAEIFTLKI